MLSGTAFLAMHLSPEGLVCWVTSAAAASHAPPRVVLSSCLHRQLGCLSKLTAFFETATGYCCNWLEHTLL
jgi:hypothetical protein